MSFLNLKERVIEKSNNRKCYYCNRKLIFNSLRVKGTMKFRCERCGRIYLKNDIHSKIY